MIRRNRRAPWRVIALVGASLALVATSGAGISNDRTAAASTVQAAPNEVTKWNSIAQTTVLGQPPNTSAPPAAAVFMGMVQGAVYGAVNAIDREHRPYLVLRAEPWASKGAAVATAAYEVLNTLFPGQQANLKAQYDESLAEIPAGSRKQAGIEVGAAAADAMLAEGHDGRQGPVPPLPPAGVGYWQPLMTTDGLAILDPSPWVATARPFLVDSSSQFRTDGPYPLTSPAYAQDFNEVKALGDIDSTVRSPDQTHTAIFWQSNPVITWNGVGRRLAESRALNLTDSALLFAMLDLAAADASINCWNDKYHWGFWRPMAAIRAADTDGNPATDPDTTWAPLFTPPYPEHPSGHMCFSTSSLTALRTFFGTDEVAFYATSVQFPGEQRPFSRFSEAVNELMEARIWAGVHFRNADEQGARLGRQVVRYQLDHWFQPVN